MVIPFVVVSALVLLCCAVGYLIVKQQGQLILRLDSIEQELTARRLQERSQTTLPGDH